MLIPQPYPLRAAAEHSFTINVFGLGYQVAVNAGRHLDAELKYAWQAITQDGMPDLTPNDPPHSSLRVVSNAAHSQKYFGCLLVYGDRLPAAPSSLWI